MIHLIAAHQTGVWGHPTDAEFSSFGEAANKYGSQPTNPFVVRPGQFHVALGVPEGLVAQPFLQHGDRHAPQHAVAAVGMPEGMGVASDRSIPEAVREPPSHPPYTMNDFEGPWLRGSASLTAISGWTIFPLVQSKAGLKL